jgi:hypothetical protein
MRPSMKKSHLSFQSIVFDRESKKLIIEKGDVKNKKGKSHSEVDLRDMRPSQISKIHIGRPYPCNIIIIFTINYYYIYLIMDSE